jgi:hypothetical protein
MLDVLECPPPELLASFLEGSGSRNERRKLVAHLDICTGCRSVLAYSSQYEATRKRERDVRTGVGLSPGSSVLGYALAAGFVVAAGLALVVPRAASRFSTSFSAAPFSTEGFVAALFLEEDTPPYSDRLWTAEPNAFSFSSGQTRFQTAFRIGVQLVDFRVGVEEGRVEDARISLRSLRNLSRSSDGREHFSEHWSFLEGALSQGTTGGRFSEELAALDRDLHIALDRTAFDLGRLAETGRLAAETRRAESFSDSFFQSVLQELAGRELAPAADAELWVINDLVSGGRAEAQIDELRKRFHQLLLIH